VPAVLIGFPAGDPEPARRFSEKLLDVELEARQDAEGEGWQTYSGAPAVSLHARSRGPGDSFSPYFTVSDMAETLAKVELLGVSLVHPGETWAVCRDSEGSPFGLARGLLGGESTAELSCHQALNRVRLAQIWRSASGPYEPAKLGYPGFAQSGRGATVGFALTSTWRL
jgi:predicted enzyme related to lactoylglutathione lyase